MSDFTIRVDLLESRAHRRIRVFDRAVVPRLGAPCISDRDGNRVLVNIQTGVLAKLFHDVRHESRFNELFLISGNHSYYRINLWA